MARKLKKTKVTEQGTVLAQCHENFENARKMFERAYMLDRWYKGRQLDVEGPAYGQINESLGDDWSGHPFMPTEKATPEYDDLVKRGPTPWARLLVTSLAQTAYVDGIRMPGSRDNMNVWETWRRNGFGAKQISQTRGAIAHGMSFGTVEDGIDPLTGEKVARMGAYSAKRMVAYYNEPQDDWPAFAIWAKQNPPDDKGNKSWTVRFFDETAIHTVTCKNDGKLADEWEYIDHVTHKFTVPPVVRLVGEVDLEGHAMGVIEPVVPLLQRIDQDTFDRLIVQRFGAWKVRYIAGMAKPGNSQEELMAKIGDFLASPDYRTKFGTLEPTEIRGFLEAGDHDLRELSAVSQIPPHHLLGLSDNLQAEALAAAEAGLQRKSLDFKTVNGEAYERLFRLIALWHGDDKEARAYEAEVTWRDTESRSLEQAAQALGNLATQLQVPVELLWEKIPGFTDVDVSRAREMFADQKADMLIEAVMAAGQQGAPGQKSTPSPMAQGEARRNAAS